MINIIQLPGDFNIEEMTKKYVQAISESMGLPKELPHPTPVTEPVPPQTKTQVIAEWLLTQDKTMSGNKLSKKLKEEKGVSVSGTYINKLKKS